MFYKLKECNYCNDNWIDKDRQSWPYIKNDDMEFKYPNGGYMIIGDIRDNKGENSESTLNYENQFIGISPYISKLKSNEYCVGYIPVDSEDSEHSYIRIVKKTNRKLLLFLILLLLGLLFFAGGNMLKNYKPDLDENAISYHIEGLENKDPENISIPLFGKVNIDSETMKSTVNLANPKGNPCYFRYSIVIKDGNIAVYESDLIEPGTAIPGFKLNKKLDKGSYPSSIIVETYSLKDHSVKMNGGEMDISLIVGKE